MSVFLRSTRTGLYRTANTGWVADRAAAAQFGGPEKALDRAAAERLQEFEVVVSYGSPGCELVLAPNEIAGRKN